MGEIINRFSYIFNICTEKVTKRCYYCNIIKMTCTRKYIKNKKKKLVYYSRRNTNVVDLCHSPGEIRLMLKISIRGDQPHALQSYSVTCDVSENKTTWLVGLETTCCLLCGHHSRPFFSHYQFEWIRSQIPLNSETVQYFQ